MKVMLPSANAHLTPEEFAKCCDLIDYYTAEGRSIFEYCAARGREPSLYDRGNVWQGGFLDAILQMILSKKYNNIDRLRLIAWHFSAYRVFDLGFVNDPIPKGFLQDFFYHRVDELPDEVDDIILTSVDIENRIERLAPQLSAILATVGGRYLHGQPMRFGEVAGEIDGLMANGDTLRYWNTIAALHRTKILEHLERKIAERGFCRVMEIGPGYGGLGYQLKKAFGDKLQFIAVDLVESLIFSSLYLTTLLDEKYLLYRDETAIDAEYGMIFVPAFRSPEFFAAIADVDLCINTISMNEMSADQVDYYGRNIAAVLNDEGMFFEANHRAEAAGPARIDCKARLAPHFAQRLSAPNTEVATDGDLDIWGRAIPEAVRRACNDPTLAAPAAPTPSFLGRRARIAVKWLLNSLPLALASRVERRLRRLAGGR